MKKIFRCLTVLIMCLLVVPAGLSKADSKTVTVTINLDETKSSLSAPPFILNRRIMVPIRFFPEEFGIKVNYDSETRIITFYMSNISIKMYYESFTAKINDQDVSIDTPYIIRESRSFVPIRFIMETFGAIVSWDPTLHKATIVCEIPEA